MKYILRQQGKSHIITIPHYITEKLKLKAGDTLDVDMQGQKIIIRKEEKNA